MPASSQQNGRGRLGLLALGALGVVYGDIGTSPLYAFEACFADGRIAPTASNVLGLLSLIFWSLVIVISVKYLTLVMRADNDGEGGILALLALVVPDEDAPNTGRRRVLVLLGLFGAALLYGDGMITPAISVLSAVEGLEVATTAFDAWIIPISIALLAGLFLVQRHGTERIAFVFSPIMLVWFAVIALWGLLGIANHPAVLAAIWPGHAVRFFLDNGATGFFTLGIVFLVVTGGEALYADMGHFGRVPIRLAWMLVVMPALVLNYFGQGALVLGEPTTVADPFYRLVAPWALYPMVGLAMAATVVASQAVISGAFSLTMQAVQLDHLPRMEIRHTSPQEYGQIFVPAINMVLLLATIGLVLTFRTSQNLAGAYGVAVTTTMVITTVLAFFAMRDLWNWKWPLAAVVAGLLLVVDVSFFAANLVKIPDGGWFSLTVGLVIVLVMTTWRHGREILLARSAENVVTLAQFLDRVAEEQPLRVPGTAIYLTANRELAPDTLLHNYEHNRVLHEQLIIVHVSYQRRPYVRFAKRVQVEPLREDFQRVTVRYGFKQSPNLPRDLAACEEQGLQLDLEKATYMVGHITLLAAHRQRMALWRERLFVFLARNSLNATRFFKLPPDQVLEVGGQVEM